MPYPDPVKAVLDDAGAAEGDRVRAATEKETFEGRVMPHHAFSADDVLTVKLDNGYNVGISVEDPAFALELVETAAAERPEPVPLEPRDDLPSVKVLGTGGTIASFVDYRTGAVYPALEADELATSVPELAQVAAVDAEVVFSMFSEDMTPEHWETLARAAVEAFEEGARGVVVPHGTDTMGYTSAALALLLRDLPGPVCVVGAQRSSDRPSTDADMNLLAATRVAADGRLGEACVVMHGETGDTWAAIHRGTRVRKCHTSRRDAFASINAPLLGRVDRGGDGHGHGDGDGKAGQAGQVELFDGHVPAGDGPPRVEGALEPDVRLVTVYPGMPAEVFAAQTDGAKGVVLQGTGLGHVGRHLIEPVADLVDQGVPVVMTSQCLWGRTNMRVYSTGRDLLAAGVVPGEDMLPETALVKLMWLVGTEGEGLGAAPDQLAERVRTPVAGEVSERTTMDGIRDAR